MIFLSFLTLFLALLQQPIQSPPPQPVRAPEEFLTNKPGNQPSSISGDDYTIGRDDLLEISVFEVPELGASIRVSASGTITLPLIGSVQALGATTEKLARDIELKLKNRYVNDPHVTVFIQEYASQPVSIIGAVRMPGIYQLKGERTLLDMLAMAQGTDPSAGNVIQIIRRPSSKDSGSGVAPEAIAVDAEELFQRGRADLNIRILPGDVINVLQAGSVFVVGEVTRPGEFVLKNGRNVTVTQAVALGSGFTKEAKKNSATIIRYKRDGTKDQLPVDVDKVIRNQAPDLMMLPNDILFIPATKVKTTVLRALDTTIAIVTGRLIYGGL